MRGIEAKKGLRERLPYGDLGAVLGHCFVGFGDLKRGVIKPSFHAIWVTFASSINSHSLCQEHFRFSNFFETKFKESKRGPHYPSFLM